MTTPIDVRPVAADDLPGLCDIVNHYIRTTTYNFRTQEQTPQEWDQEWRAKRGRYPWLVAVSGQRVLGLAYAGPWSARGAYAWSAEVTGYVAPELRGGGVGRALYRRLLDTLDGQGYRTAVAGISLPNPASVAFHESFGFTHVGTLTAIGYKLGRWCDVGYWQRSGTGPARPPQPVRPPPAG